MTPPDAAAGVAAIVLAGGRSSRMGSWKAALPWVGGMPLLAAHVAALRAAGARPVVVAVPRDRDAAWRGIGMPGDIVAWIDDSAAPPFATLQTALRALGFRGGSAPPSALSLLFLAPVDTVPVAPGVSAALLAGIQAAGPDAVAVRPAWSTPSGAGEPARRGHPLLLRAAWAASLPALDPAVARLDHLLRDIGPARVPDVRVDDPLVLANLNTPADHAAALEQAGG